MRGYDHESQIEIAVGDDEIVKQKITQGVEQHVGHPSANGVAEHLQGHQRPDRLDVETVDRTDYQLRDAHQRAV